MYVGTRVYCCDTTDVADTCPQSYGCQNSKLLNGILKTELGFEGFVLSDWEAQVQDGIISTLREAKLTET